MTVEAYRAATALLKELETIAYRLSELEKDSPEFADLLQRTYDIGREFAQL